MRRFVPVALLAVCALILGACQPSAPAPAPKAVTPKSNPNSTTTDSK